MEKSRATGTAAHAVMMCNAEYIHKKHTWCETPPGSCMRLLVIVCMVLLAVVPQAGLVADQTVTGGMSPVELLEAASLLGAGDTAVYRLTMDIDNGKSTKSRTLELYRETGADTEKMLVQIVQPAFLNNMKLLSIQEGNSETAWLKTSRGVKRLNTAEDREQSLFDSDFSTKDLEDLTAENYTLSIVEKHAAVTVLKAEPVKQQDPRLITIDTEHMLIVKVEYVNKQQQIYKRYTVEEIHTENGGTGAESGKSGPAYPKVSTMEHPLEGTVTTLTVVERELPESLSPRYFNSRQL